MLSKFKSHFPDNLSLTQSANFKSDVLSPLSSIRFSQIFTEYIKSSDEKPQMILSYKSLFDDLAKAFCQIHKLRIFDLACGNGETTSMVLNNLQGRFECPIEVYARDKDTEMVYAYSKLLKKNHPEISLHIEQGNAFAEFNENCQLTFVSHALYHCTIEQAGSVLKNIRNTLVDGGIALISLLNQDSDFNIIQDYFVSNFKTANTSHLDVNITSMEMLIRAAQCDESTLANSEIIPYSAKIFLPIKICDFTAFMQSAIDPTNSSIIPEFSLTKDLLEFMLHRDWDSLANSGALPVYLDLVKKLINSGSTDSNSLATLNLSGSTLVLRK